MQVNFQIYKNSHYVVNNQRQNSIKAFTSKLQRVTDVFDAATKAVNPVLEEIRTVFDTPKIQEQIFTLRQYAQHAKTADEILNDKLTQESFLILKELKNELSPYVEKMHNDESGIIERFTESEINSLTILRGQLGIITPVTSVKNQAIENVLEGDVLSHIEGIEDMFKETSLKNKASLAYTVMFKDIAAGVEFLQELVRIGR